MISLDPLDFHPKARCNFSKIPILRNMGGGVVRSERSFFSEKFYSGRNISENHVRFEYYFFFEEF